jgi:ADP-heptose:LPS heptosyltransferase
VNSRKVKLALTLSIIFMVGITSFVFFSRIKEPRPIAQIQPIVPPTPPQIVEEPPKTNLIIDEFNQVNSQITSFSSSQMIVKVWENDMRIKISGSMYYEKPKCFRFLVWTGVGRETDIGSNDEIFWYWSRRDRHPGLYYANYDDYTKTRLKTPFNPVFMRESLGLEQIDPKNAKIVDSEKHVMITWQKINASNNKILYSMFINKATKRMDGIVVSDLDGKTLASCEITYEGLLPKKILYDWQEEQRSLTIEFSDVEVNLSLDKKIWQMPRYLPRIDMGKE